MADSKDEVDDLPMPIIENDRFRVPWSVWQKPSLMNVAKWMLFSPDRTRVPTAEKLNVELPIHKPDFTLPITDEDIIVTWLGHATVVMQMEDMTFITDPIFSDRASPCQQFGSKRFCKAPCTIDELPKIDFVLISHNHYDHLDYDSVRKLNLRFGNQITWFVPLGLKNWMTNSGCENVYELNWWQSYKLNNFEIVATPAQHWSKRTLNDDNKTLWASWCVLGKKNRFFFAGDTGYPEEQPIFKIIGKKYGPFNLAAIPIGAYEPRWFMRDQHVDPAEAVKIHIDLRARHSIGIHWGTFALANEHYLEPRDELSKVLLEQNIDEAYFFTLGHGKSRTVSMRDGYVHNPADL